MVSKYCRVCMQSASYRIGSGLVSIKRGTLLCRSIPLVLLFFFFFFFFFGGRGGDGEGQQSNESTITMFQFLSQQEEQLSSVRLIWFIFIGLFYLNCKLNKNTTISERERKIKDFKSCAFYSFDSYTSTISYMFFFTTFYVLKCGHRCLCEIVDVN